MKQLTIIVLASFFILGFKDDPDTRYKELEKRVLHLEDDIKQSIICFQMQAKVNRALQAAIEEHEKQLNQKPQRDKSL